MNMDGTEKQNQIDAAMAHFGLVNELPYEQTAFVTARLLRMTPDVIMCRIYGPLGTEPREYEFLRSAVSAQFFTAEKVLVEIPYAFVQIFGLEGYLVTGDQLEIYREAVKQHNAPYLKQAGKQPEKVGSVRL